MKLLTAINEVLTTIGEHPVTSVENKNPSVSIIKRAIHSENQRLQAMTWWFNTYRTTLYADSTGRIKLPPETLEWDWEDHPSLPRGQYLIDSTQMREDWRELGVTSVTGRITIAVDFEDLPFSFAQWVTASAAIKAYVDDAGVDDALAVFSERLNESSTEVMAAHLRHKRYNSRNRPEFRRVAQHLWR